MGNISEQNTLCLQRNYSPGEEADKSHRNKIITIWSQCCESVGLEGKWRPTSGSVGRAGLPLPGRDGVGQERLTPGALTPG